MWIWYIEHLVDSELIEHSILLKLCVQDSPQAEGRYFWESIRSLL